MLLLLVVCLLFGLELKVAGYGLLTVDVAVSLVFGLMILMDSSASDLCLSLRLVLPVVAGFVAIGALLTALAVSAQRMPARMGQFAMVGLVGQTLSTVGPDLPCRVVVRGGNWRAADQPFLAAASRCGSPRSTA